MGVLGSMILLIQFAALVLSCQPGDSFARLTRRDNLSWPSAMCHSHIGTSRLLRQNCCQESAKPDTPSAKHHLQANNQIQEMGSHTSIQVQCSYMNPNRYK